MLLRRIFIDAAELGRRRRHIRDYEARRSMLKWLGVILVASVIVILFMRLLSALVNATYRS